MRRAVPIVLALVALLTTAVSIPLSLDGSDLYDTIAYPFLAVTMAAAGLLVVLRVRGNPIGWVMLAIGVMGGIGELLEGWGMHPELPASDIAAWTAASLVYVGIGLIPVLLMLFPTGRLPTPNWRPWLWITVAGIPVSIAGSTFGHYVQRYGRLDANPIAVPGPAADVVFAIGQVALGVGLIASVISVVVRYRRAAGLERQQLKWITVSTGLLLIVGPLSLAFFNASSLVQLAIALTIMTLPVTIAIAVLRYRLYAIDRIISRTASYAIVTVLLVGAYALVVVTISAILPGLPSVAVALATLAAAGLFLPVLRRVQVQVDRRFDRARYDGQKVVDAFGERLRTGSDPFTAAADVSVAVQRSLQPASLGLWLAKSESARSDSLARTITRP